MNIKIIKAESKDIPKVSSILNEAADWLKEKGMPMWRGDELLPEKLKDDVEKGLFYINEYNSSMLLGETINFLWFQIRKLCLQLSIPALQLASLIKGVYIINCLIFAHYLS